jgi:hypothetical protein
VVFANHPEFGITGIEHNVSEMDLFPSSGKGKETHILLGLLERANFSHWNFVLGV